MGLSPANQGHICRAACYLIGLNSRMGLRVFEPSTWNIQMSWAVFFGRGRRRKRRRRGGPNQPTVRVARCPFLRNSRNPAASAALSSPPRAQWCGFVSLSGRWSEVQVQFLHFFCLRYWIMATLIDRVGWTQWNIGSRLMLPQCLSRWFDRLDLCSSFCLNDYRSIWFIDLVCQRSKLTGSSRRPFTCKWRGLKRGLIGPFGFTLLVANWREIPIGLSWITTAQFESAGRWLEVN